MERIRYNFKGTEITFLNGDGIMVNATEMAKPFGKNLAHWLSNDSTKTFIAALASSKGIERVIGNPTTLSIRQLATAYPSLIKIVQGGNASNVTQGTWMHEDY